jgi:hypothetical protein
MNRKGGDSLTPRYEPKVVLGVGALFVAGIIMLRLIVDHAFSLSNTDRLMIAVALGISIASALGWKGKAIGEHEPSMWWVITCSAIAQIAFVIIALVILLV